MKLTAFTLCAFICGALAAEISLPSIKYDPPSEILFKTSELEYGHVPFVVECLATGQDVQYTWIKNGNQFDWQSNPNIVKRQGEGSLVFLKPNKEDEGLYECQATNKNGVASSAPINVKRTFIDLPKVSPVNFSPKKGHPFQLNCPIPQAYPKPRIQWYSQHKTDATVIDAVLDKRITLDPAGTLWFSNVTEDDASPNFKYTCMAYTPALDNKPAPLAEAFIEKVEDSTENDNELTAQYLSEDMTAYQGDTTALYCIFGGTPLAHPDWFKDGKDTNNKPGDRVTRHNRSAGKRLLIRDTRYEDTGNYTCIVDNGVGQKKVHSMYLTVEGKPVFMKKPEKQTTVKKGEKVQIPCIISGKPTPTISWTYNGKALPKERVTNDGFLINDAKDTDVGVYGCKAFNKNGVIYSETALYIQ